MPSTLSYTIIGSRLYSPNLGVIRRALDRGDLSRCPILVYSIELPLYLLALSPYRPSNTISISFLLVLSLLDVLATSDEESVSYVYSSISRTLRNIDLY